MYLSLPLPSTSVRTMSLTVLSTDGNTFPSTFTVTVPKCGRLKDLIEGLSTACSLRDDEIILIAEVSLQVNYISGYQLVMCHCLFQAFILYIQVAMVSMHRPEHEDQKPWSQGIY